MNSCASSWALTFQKLASRALGKVKAATIWDQYQSEFSTEYQTLVTPHYALQDVLNLEWIDNRIDRVSLLKPTCAVDDYRLHFYSEHPRFLDEYIPILENMHLRVLDQIRFTLNVRGRALFIRSFTVKAGAGQIASLALLRQRLLAAVHCVLAGKVENDALNKLILLAGLSWQSIEVLRAYRNYLLQIAQNTTRASIHHALLNNPRVALGLFDYFEARFRPESAWQDSVNREEQALMPLRLQLLEAFTTVVSINDDRILRTLFNLIDATMRSNFHLRKDRADFFVAFKINSLGVFEMPAPKPHYEIYVHSADMEGIHLRAGKISRGGIRWSDRPDDFRSEILGLMQTQISKNALIIPTGAKGGFVLKQNGVSLDWKEAGKKAYLTLIQGLLDLTDNLIDGQCVKLPKIVAYDDPDPYLVVAADKGTAKFSDIANGVAQDYRFWLGDAFASGGSFGYDHKALGITARGAWECIKRHFRELGKDIQTEPFTVVGIGSMDGDVFGNGMLLSTEIQLRAAFSGQHIFIDPNPFDNKAAFAERKRLFELNGSTWNDYDRRLISPGGGVFARSDKAISVSTEVRQWLNIRHKVLDGETLIRYLLCAPVDLLWLGGIGTYVKASSEKHEEVGDRANDTVRVDASMLQAKVVGEGANLGFTQKARIEYALQGRAINTDAIDNSAGVDTSDHEVNLKIFLNQLPKQVLQDDPHTLFAEMTEAVCALVLEDNIAQSLCLSLEQLRSLDNAGTFLQLAEQLDNMDFLDRVVESFPPAKEILARPGQRMTRPELAVLMSSSKRCLTHQLEQQPDFLSADFTCGYLSAYFPAQIQERFAAHISEHPLAHAIKATLISNRVINQAGASFLNLVDGDESVSIVDWVSVYLTYDQVLEADTFRNTVRQFDNKMAATLQNHLLLWFENNLVELCQRTLAMNMQLQPDTSTIKRLKMSLTAYNAMALEKIVSQELPLVFYQNDLPESIMATVNGLIKLKDFPFLVSLAEQTGRQIADLLQWHLDLLAFLELPEIYRQLAKLSLQDYWQRKVVVMIEREVQQSLARLIKKMLAHNVLNCLVYFEQISEKTKITRYRKSYQEAMHTQPMSVLPWVILSKALQTLVDG